MKNKIFNIKKVQLKYYRYYPFISSRDEQILKDLES